MLCADLELDCAWLEVMLPVRGVRSVVGLRIGSSRSSRVAAEHDQLLYTFCCCAFYLPSSGSIRSSSIGLS